MLNLKNTYNRADFISFLANSFLPEDFTPCEEPIELKFCSQYATKATRLGRSKVLELEIFEIYHDSTHDARVGISKDSFELLKRNSYWNRALVVFIPNTGEQYRFSFIQIEFTQADNETRVRKHFSNTRRYSFLLGNGTHTKTPEQFLLQKGRLKAKDGDYFKDLLDRFSVEVLTKQFYAELFAWYQWALSEEIAVTFPNDTSTEDDDRKIEEHIIRLITRLMFVWFIKQKKLIPDSIFDLEELNNTLVGFDPQSKKSGNYYNAILQNLFFGTLNKPIHEREFASSVTSSFQGKNEHYGIKTLFRNANEGSWFKQPNEEVIALFNSVPFLNGGLFECLDKTDEKGKVFYYDGFSRAKGTQKRAFIPNCLFFDPERGLIPLLQKYNFTIEENSPNDIEVALDPELLGKVFENLLGAYNPETKDTARKQSGSFYTPREIVNYMVNESLIAYLMTACSQVDEKIIRELITADTLPAELNRDNVLCTTIAEKLKAARILDPACGSGAFPMGILNRMIVVLKKLDTENEHTVYDLKLNLIEKCIFGIDIQTIAVQISKLRFFISLVCEQEKDDSQENFGILALPNLETNFVAANTLIGLTQKPAMGNLFENLEIEPTKNALKEVRHKHFSATNASQKKEYRQQDAVLRKKLAKLLEENDSFSPENARQLAEWNPYDQNTSSGFFDAEWMFGLSKDKSNSGYFDVVIGNPPYVKARDSKDKLMRAAIERIYSTTFKMWDLYIPFLEQSLNLLNFYGVSTMIIPDTIGIAEYTRKIVELIEAKHSLKKIVFFPNQYVFESASVRSKIVFIGKQKKSNEIETSRLVFENSIFKLLSPVKGLDKYLYETSALVLNLNFCENLGSICYVSYGLRLNSEKEDIDKFQKKDLISEFKSDIHIKKYTEGKYIDKYKINKEYWLEWNTERCPSRLVRATFPELYQPEKLLLARQKKIATFSSDGHICDNTIIIALPHSALESVKNSNTKKYYSNISEKRSELVNVSKNYSLKYILAIINSSLMRYYIDFMTKGRIDVYPDDWKKIPIKQVDKIKQNKFVEIADDILLQKSKNINADTEILEQQIDHLVYKLYELSYAEVKVIDPAFGLSAAEYAAVEV